MVKFISYADVSAYLCIALCILKRLYLSCAVTSVTLYCGPCVVHCAGCTFIKKSL